MIIEPEFPSTFSHLLSTIIAKQLESDKAKAKLDKSYARELFALLCVTESECLQLEDLYIFLKKRGLALSKKELKFVNKYFGFSRHEKLTFQNFQKYFFEAKDPKNMKFEKGSNQIQCFVDLVQAVVEAIEIIQQRRVQAASNTEELKRSLSQFYQDQMGILSAEVIRQALYCSQLYSRLNFALLWNYMVGEGKEITIKQLFAFEGTITTEGVYARQNSNSQVKENKRLSLGTSTPEAIKISGEFKLKSQASDILLQIQNIEWAIKQKKELYSQRKKMLEDESVRSKPVGTLLKRPSMTEIKPSFKQNKESMLDNTQIVESKYYKQQKANDQPKPQLPSRQNSSQKYSFVDMVQEDKDCYDSKDIDQLLRTRLPSKSREETLNKASSCARLKIQEIQRRVMGRVGQRAAALKAQDYVSRVPSDLRMKNANELRSKYSSLNRN